MLMNEQEEKIAPMYGEPVLKYPFSENGIAWQREFHCQDVCLDHWHPYQKAQYPEFFARREELKEEFLKLYEETYGDLMKGLHVERHDTHGLLPHDYDEEAAEKLKLDGKDPQLLGDAMPKKEVKHKDQPEKYTFFNI